MKKEIFRFGALKKEEDNYLQFEPNKKILMKAFKDAVAEGKKRVEEGKQKIKN